MTKKEDICQLCLAEGPDKRTLTMSCFYDITEIVPEFSKQVLPSNYHIRICKACRGDLLGKLEAWRTERLLNRGWPMDDDGNLIDRDPGKNIPVRINGAIQWMNGEEYEEYKKQTS